MVQKVLITGINGQLGSLMAEFLIANPNLEIYGISRDGSYRNLDKLKEVKNFNLIKLDIVTERDKIKDLISLHLPDYIFNFAAISNINECEQNRVLAVQSNLQTIVTILQSVYDIKRWKNPIVINAGSIRELGKDSIYAETKRCARQYIDHYRQDRGIKAIQPYISLNDSENRISESFVSRKIINELKQIWQKLEFGGEINILKLGNIDQIKYWAYSKDVIKVLWEFVIQATLDRVNLIDYSKIAIFGENHTVREFLELALDAIEINWFKKKGDPNSYYAYYNNKEVLIVQSNPELYTNDSDLSVNKKEYFNLLDKNHQTPFWEMVYRMAK